MKTIEGYNIKIFTDNIEQEALDQINGLLKVGVFDGCKVRIMPDVHSGAGCVMSRVKAKQTLDLDVVKESMKGIDTWSLNMRTIDEAPQAYKPMQEIIDNIQDTVEIIDIIKPVYNFKADE